MNTAGTVLAEEPVEVGAPGAPRLHLLGFALRRAVLDECLTAASAVLLATVVEDYTANGDGVTVRIASPPGVWTARGHRPARTDLAAALTGRRPPVVGLVGNADPHGLVVREVRDRVLAPCWADGRVTLLGDAAHPRSRISAREPPWL
ncbi:hypothetical protein [Streptomyces sp. NPDC050388]|uniref:hypothetical protein n=1 Tax=Streptomyces sp. NPDC050388 TaxID=3155781 RepID=UPI00341C13F9